MKYNAVLLLFVFCLTNVKALVCQSAGDCLPISEFNFSVINSQTTQTKYCDDFCVYFHCQIGADQDMRDAKKIMRGAGCWNDFVNACKDIIQMDKIDIFEGINDENYETYQQYAGTFFGPRYNITKHDKLISTVNSAGLDLITIPSSHAARVANSTWDFEEMKISWAFLTSTSNYEACQYDTSQPILLPSVTCDYGKINLTLYEFHNRAINNDYGLDTTETKTCDACVYYRCIVDNDVVIIGYGCPADFDDACERVLWPAIKRRISKNSKNYSHYNPNIIFYSCSDSNYCSEYGYKKFDHDANMEFGFWGSDDIDGKHCFNEYYHPPLNVVECSLGGICEAASQHVLNKSIEIHPIKKKNCSACVYFHCYIGNKIVKAGYGCPEDFERLCPAALTSENYNNETKKNIKLAYAYEENYMLYSCSDGNDCAVKYGPGFLKTYFNSDFIDRKVKPENIDTSFTGKCDYEGDNNDIINSATPTHFILFTIAFAFGLIMIYFV